MQYWLWLMVCISLAESVNSLDCQSHGAVTIDHRWPLGASGVLHIRFPESVTLWRVRVLFDNDVVDMETWLATPIRRTSSKYVLKNKYHNGVQNAGTVLSINFNYYFVHGATPQIQSVRINGHELCRPQVIVSTTATQSPAENHNCINAGTIIENTVWPSGMNAALVLRFTQNVRSWTARIVFSGAVSVFEIWDADYQTTDNTVFELTNKEYNGAVSAGQDLTITFNAHFVSRRYVVNVQLNGQDQCVGTVSTIVSTVSTTQFPSSTSPPTINTATTDPSTTNPTPTTVATTEMSTSSSTNTLANDCYTGRYVTESNTWHEGKQVHLRIPFTEHVDSWQLVMVLDSPATYIEVWVADQHTEDRRTFVLTNKDYNSVQTPGSVVEIDLVIHFVTEVFIHSLKLNDDYLCSNGMITTISTTSSTDGSTATGVTTSSTTTQSLSTNTDSSTSITSSTSSVTTATVIISTSTVTSTPVPHQLPYNYSEVIDKSLLFYEAQRSGHLPESNRVTWRGDSALNDGADVGHSLSGGYYDAGDHVKFGFPMAAAFSLISWGAIDFADGYESAGQMEYLLEAIKWATDYMIKCHTAEYELYGQVGLGGEDHSYWGRPEDMTMFRPSFKITASSPGSELAAETAAALAAASIVFETTDGQYSLELKQHSEVLYRFANEHRRNYHESINDAANFYRSWSGYGDELAWAALWLYKATGEARYLEDAELHFQSFSLGQQPSEFSWDNKVAGVQVLLHRATHNAQYRTHVQQFCDWVYSSAPRTPNGLVFLNQWGSLRHAANAVFICLQAAEDGINSQQYRTLAEEQIGYMLGDTGRSFVVGFGNNPPQRPHHRSSSCPWRPDSCGWQQLHTTQPNPHILYGALVGGPDINDIYTDDRENAVNNEVALDYNAAFQGAVAALLSLHVREQI